MMTPEFSTGVDELRDFGRRRNVAVMCAEAVWWQCHRMLLADALVARGVDVQHIMNTKGASALQPHRLTPFAQIGLDGDVRYPGVLDSGNQNLQNSV